MNPHGCKGGFPIASENARRYLKAQSVYHDVGIGPKGLEATFMPGGHSIPGEGNRMFPGQKSNAAFAAANMFLRFYHTYDLDYARRVYPFLTELLGGLHQTRTCMRTPGTVFLPALASVLLAMVTQFLVPCALLFAQDAGETLRTLFRRPSAVHCHPSNTSPPSSS
jgi:hypothetical protein